MAKGNSIPPKKKSSVRKEGVGHFTKLSPSEGEPVWDLRPENLRTELQSLQSLAEELGVREMKAGYVQCLGWQGSWE